jgi:tetratricopeptide (TPR) repeat protein
MGGDLRGAEELLTRAIDLDPRHAPAWHLRALARSDLGRFDEAFRDWDRALGLIDDAEMRISRARARFAWYHSIGSPTDRFSEFLRRMAEDVDRALELAPESPFVLENAGHHRLMEGRASEALQLWRKAIAIDPSCERRLKEPMAEAERRLKE